MASPASLEQQFSDRIAGLRQAPIQVFGQTLRVTVEWLRRTTAAVAALEPPEDFDAVTWLEEHGQPGQPVAFHGREREAACISWHLMVALAAARDPSTPIHAFGRRVCGVETTLAESHAFFVDTFIEPFALWLRGEIAQGQQLRELLERYAREVAWFRRDDLRARYEGDTQRAEKVLDFDLRYYLTRNGVPFPFSQPEVPRGRPDIVVPDNEAQPLPIEVKVFDPDRHDGIAVLRDGVRQAIFYAHAYDRIDAYLIVFDVRDRLTILHRGEGARAEQASPRALSLRCDGVDVTAVVVPLGEQQPPTAGPTSSRILVDSAMLCPS